MKRELKRKYKEYEFTDRAEPPFPKWFCIVQVSFSAIALIVAIAAALIK